MSICDNGTINGTTIKTKTKQEGEDSSASSNSDVAAAAAATGQGLVESIFFVDAGGAAVGTGGAGAGRSVGASVGAFEPAEGTETFTGTAASAAAAAGVQAAPSPDAAVKLPPYPSSTPILHSGPIEIRSTEGKGRGVFATRELGAGEVIDVSPVLVISREEYYGLDDHGNGDGIGGNESPSRRNRGVDGSVLKDYVFTWKGKEGGMAVALGVGSLFNHSENPNVTFLLDCSMYTIQYRTFRRVQAGDELCIFYGQHAKYSNSALEPLPSSARVERKTETKEEKELRQIWGGLEGLADDKDWSSEDGSGSSQDGSGSDMVAKPHRGIRKRASDVGPGAISTWSSRASLTPDFKTNIEDMVPFESLAWEKVTRILQPHEIPLTLINVSVVDVPSRHAQAVFRFNRENKFDQPSIQHLKRVRKKDDIMISVILCHEEDVPVDLDERLAKSRLAQLEVETPVPYIMAVPATIARTTEQAREWGKVWPVSMLAIRTGPLAAPQIQGWARAKEHWVNGQIVLAWKASLESETRGEHPIACHVTESFDPLVHSWRNLPKTLVRAHDTRLSTGNPLCHCAANAIDAVAVLDRLRLREPPLQDPPLPIPYLLTGLSVFISHEPCLMCSMSLLHSRIGNIYYVKPAPGSGGCGSTYSVHEDEGLNHRFEAWQWRGKPQYSQRERDVGLPEVGDGIGILPLDP